MSEKVAATGCNCEQVGGLSSDEVCIQTNKVYDSCRDKECIENLRVYLTETGQQIVERAINVKCRKSEIIWVYTDVDRLKPMICGSTFCISCFDYNPNADVPRLLGGGFHFRVSVGVIISH